MITNRTRLNRRMFLRGAGVSMALPMLDAMTGRAAEAVTPRRLVAIQTNQGIMPHLFYPEPAAADALNSPYLDLLTDHRKQFSIFSGLSHPGVDGGHANEKSFLTAAPHPSGGAFRNTISLDQYAAEKVGGFTRFRSLVLGISSARGGVSMSYTRSGVMIPGEGKPLALYQRLFVQGAASETAARSRDLAAGRSLLDFVRDSSKRLERDLGPADKSRLDQYQTAIRELELELIQAQEWEKKPKPTVKEPAPADHSEPRVLHERVKAMLGVVKLALETDSTRVITLFIEPLGVLSAISGVTNETHSLTHHGNRPEMIAELRRIEETQMRTLGVFLAGLSTVKESGDTLLDRTQVLYGTCMGNANGHHNNNWPLLLAGGGYRHGKHFAFDTTNNSPIGNLFVSMLQRLGVEADRFASGTRTLRGLEKS